MSISRKFQRSKSKYTLSQKIISAVTAAGFIMQPFTAFAGEIIKPGGTNLINDKVADIWADKVVGNAAVNVFDKFNLSANEIANMYFKTQQGSEWKDNLVNFVNSRIDINGTVNAVKDNKIGGNLFFLSKDGMAVGKSGVINTGSLYVMTPTPDFMEAVQTVGTEAPAEDANKYLGYITNITDPTKANAWEIIPVNTSGTITVLGKVNATNEVQMRAAKIGVGKNVSGELKDDEGTVIMEANAANKEAYIKTGITNFADIVNIKDSDGSQIVTNAGLTGNLIAEQTGSGDIVLSAYVDGATKENDLEVLPVAGATLGPIAETVENTFVEQDFNASVDVYGTVETTGEKGDININATAVNSNADFDEKLNDYKANNNDVAQLANVKAEVNIDGAVKAAEDVTVKAEAINRYIDNSGSVAKGASLAVGSVTPITGDIAYSVLNTEANVNITSKGSIESGKGVDIDAKAETLAASAASVTALKFKAAGGTTGANVPAVSVLYTGADNKANVTVEGNVKAAENISIDADADMKVDAENKMGIKGKMGNQFVVGVTVAGAENSASVDIKDEDNSNNVINAGNDLSVNANATSDFTSGTSIKAPEASAMAVAVNVTDFNSNAKVNIDTDLTAGNDLTVKADNIITDDNVIAESTIGSGKYVSAATQVVTGHVEQKKGEVKEFISGLAAVLGKGKKLPIGDEDEIPGLQLSEIFKAGATVTYSGQKHDSSVTIGKNASLKANEGKLDIGALTKIEDAHITATGTTSSYNDAYPAELTVNAAVLVNNMDNSSSVVVADRDEGSADALKGKNGVSVNASTRFEYNRIKNMIQDVKDAAKQIASAVGGLNGSIKNDFNGFIDTLNKQIDAWESAFKTADETLATSDKGVLAIGEAATAGYNVLTALNNLNTMLDNSGSEVAAGTKAAIQGASDLLTSALAFADPNSYGNFAASSASKGSSGDTGSIAGHHSSAVNGAGTVMVNTVNSVSKVEIGSNAVINADGKVELNAENYMKDVSLGGLNTVPLTNSGGGTAASIGATVNYSDFNTDTVVAVNDGAEISGGDINIAGSNEIDHVSVAGSAGMGPSDETESKGIVLNGMLSFVDGSSDILTVVDDGAKLTAEKKEYKETDDKGETETKTSEGSISISGHNDTNIVNVAAGLNLGSGSGAVGVGLAYNDFAVKNIAGAYSGAAALQWKSGGSASDTSAGFSGAAGVNDIDNVIKATISNSVINDAGTIDTLALSGGEQLALGLGLNVAKSGSTSGYTGNAAVSVNLIDHDVEALHENNTVTSADDINVAAYARDIENTGGGSLSAGQQKVGVGASVGVAMLNNNISAGIKGGSYTNVGSVDVEALNALKNITVGIAAGLTIPSDGNAASANVEGAGVYNEVHNTTNAFIEGNDTNNKVGIETVDGGEVSVIAQDVAINENSVYEMALENLADGKEEIAKRMGAGYDVTGQDDLNDIDMSDAITQTGDDIKVNKEGGSSIITVAGGIAGTTGKGAGGAAVAITDIENTYTAKIDYADITAETVSADAGSNSNIVTVAGGIAAASKGSGVGSVSWNDVVNTANVDILNSTVKAQSTIAEANNAAQIVSVGGQISGAGKAAVGATLSYVGLDNTTKVNISTTEFDERTANEGTSVTAKANNTSDSYNIGAGVSAGGTASVSGTVVVTQTKGTAGAVMDGAKINNAKEIIAHASDDTDILSVIGTVNIAGKAAVGAGVAYTEIGGDSDDKEKAEQHVTAEIKNSTINTDDAGSTVEVKAEDEARVINVAVGVGGAANAAVQGASATTLINKETSAGINSTNIDAGHEGSTKANVTVDAQNSSEITSSADVAAAAGSGAGVGAGIAVNRIIQQTNATVNGGTMNINNLTVNANAAPRIENIGIGAGVAGTGAGVTGSVAVNMIENDVAAHIGGGANIVADDNVGVVATSDEQIANYVGSASVAGTGAAVGASVSVNKITGTTSATVGDENTDTKVTAKGNGSDLTSNTIIYKNTINNALIDNDTVDIDSHIARGKESRKGLIVDASSTRDMKSFLINASVAGEGAGVTGTVNVNIIDGATEAGITDTVVNGGSTAIAGQNANVFVNAGDYTNSSGFVGGASVAGIGGGVGLASDTNTVERTTSAIIEDSDIKADKFEVDADSMQGVSSFTVSAGVAGIGAGVSGVVSVTDLKNTTQAAFFNSKVTADTVDIKATHKSIINAGNVGVGAAGLGAGVGLSVGVLKDNSETRVDVGDNEITLGVVEESEINAEKDVNVAATNNAVVKPVISATGAGAAGAAGAISINNINSVVKTNINHADINSKQGNITGNAQNAFDIDAYMGGNAAGAFGSVGVSVTVNTIDSTIQTNVTDSELTAENGDITLTAEETRNIEQIATNVSGSIGVSAGANIAITNVGEDVENDENSNAADKIAEANNMYSNNDGNDIGSLMGGASDALNTARINDAVPTIGAGYGGDKDSQITVNITGSDIDAGNTITAKATESDNISMTLGSGAAGAAAVNAGVGILNVHRNVGVNITGAEITAEKAVELASVINGSSNLDVYQGTVSILGVNAAYGGATSDGTSGVTISSGTIDGGSINILAEDAGRTDVDAIGITAGVVSAGAIVAEGTNESQTAVNISDTEMNSDADIDIKAERQAKDSEGNTTDAKGNKYASLNINATAGSGGLLGAGAGLGAVAEEKGSVKVNLSGMRNTLTAGEALNINAFNAPVVNVSATSGAGSLIAAASVTYAKANIDMDTEVNVDGYNTTLAAGSDKDKNEGINISAEADAAQNVKMQAVGVAIGGAGQANAAEVNITSDVKVDIAGNTAFKANVEKENVDVNIKADNTATQSANAYGLAVSGLVASGTNLGKTNSNLTTTVDLKGSRYDSGIDNLTANAHSKVDISNYVNGDGGALLDVSPYAAKTENSVISNTNVNIGGRWDITGNMDVKALHENEIDLNADALKAAVAGLSGVHANNKIENNTGVKFINATVNSDGSQNISARNTIDYTNIVKGSGYGAANVTAVWAEDDLDLKTNVSIENSELKAEESITVDALTGDAGYNPDGEPVASVDKEVTIKSAGVIAGTDAISTDNIDFINNIKVDKDSSVATVGKEIDKADITFTAADRTNFTDIVTADTQGGVVGASGSVLNNNFNRENTITVEGTVDKDNSYTVDKDNSYTVDSNHDANFDAGNTSVLNLTLKSNAYNKTAAPIATNPTINGIMKQTSSINFTAGKAVESLRNINVAAGEGDTTIAKESKMWRWVTGGETGTGSIASTTDGTLSFEDADVKTTVNVDGKLLAGKNNELTITITDSEEQETALDNAIKDYNGGAEFGTAEGALIAAQKDYDAFVKQEDGLEDKSQALEEAQKKYENNKTAYDIFLEQGKTIKDKLEKAETNLTNAQNNLSAAKDALNGWIDEKLEDYNDNYKPSISQDIDRETFIEGLTDATTAWYALYHTDYDKQTDNIANIERQINGDGTAANPGLQAIYNDYAAQKESNDANLAAFDIVALEQQIEQLNNEIEGIVGGADYIAVKEALDTAKVNYDAALEEGFSEENINKNIFVNAGSDKYVSIEASPWFEDLYGSPAQSIGMAEYASALLERYGQLADMMQEYAGTEVSKTYSGEMTRIQRELIALGVGRVDDNGIFAVTANSIVPTIELEDLTVSGGDINISGGSLNGSGAMTANGNPILTIDNQSNFFLKVNDITVDNDGGSIMYNNTAIDGSYGGIDVNADTGVSGAQINISSSDNVKASESEYYTPDIGIFGTVSNPYGDIIIYNQYNSIYVAGKVDGVSGVLQEAGSLKGRTVTLTAGGSVTQGYSDGITDVAGDPKHALDADYIEPIQKALIEKLDNKQINDDGNYYAAFSSVEALAEFLTGLEVDGTKLDSANAMQAAKQLTGEIDDGRAGITAGGAIYINAASINVNGKIQSGYENYVLNIKQDIAQDLIDAGTPGAEKRPDAEFKTDEYLVTDITKSGAYYDDTTGKFVYGIKAWYNSTTGQIFTEDIEQAGGGRIYLTGAIANTNASGGKLIVLDGGSDYYINSTVDGKDNQFTLKLGSINAETVEGRIEINDTNKNTTTVYTKNNVTVDANGDRTAVYNPKDGQYYIWSNGTANRVTVTYEHVSDTSWFGLAEDNWQSAVGSLDEVTKDNMQVGEPDIQDEMLPTVGNIITDGSLDGDYKHLDNVAGSETIKDINADGKDVLYQIAFERKGKPKQGVNEAGKPLYWAEDGDGNKILVDYKTNSPYYLTNADGTYIYETIISDKVTTTENKDPLGWWGKTVTTRWKETSGMITAYNFGLKADNSIGIEFVGQAEGSTGTIKSNSDILLGGDIHMGQVDIISTTGSIGHIDDETVISDNAKFKAYDDINVIQKNVNDELRLKAESTNGGDINIQAIASNANNDVYIDNVSTAGNVNITAEGSLLTEKGDTVVLTGNGITLQSYGGGIDLVIDGGTEGTNAYAVDDISLTEATGNMYLGEIVAEDGNVVLEVKDKDAGFVDAIVNNSNDNKDSTRIDEWEKLGLLDDGTNDDQLNNWDNQKENLANAALNGSMFMDEEGNVTLKEAQKQGKDLLAAGDEFVDLMKGGSKDVQAARKDLNAKQGALNEAIANLGDDAASKEAYQNALDAYNAAYDKYQQLGAEYEQDKATFIENSVFADNEQAVNWLLSYEAIGNAADDNYGWTQQQLLYAVQDTVINPNAGSVSDVKTANVTGNNITFISNTGNLGVVDEMASSISSSDLTKLFTGEKEDATGFLDKLASARAGDVVWGDTEITVRRTTPVSVKLNSDNGKVTVQNSSGDTPTVDHIYLLAKDSVLNANEFAANDLRLSGQEGLNVNKVTGSSIYLEGGSGNIGALDKTLQAVQVALNEGGFISANAAGNVALQQAAGNNVDFTLGSVAGTKVNITANGDIVSRTDDISYINASETINLTSGGGIGTVKDGEIEGLRIKNSGAVVNTDVQNAINIEAKQDGTLILGTMEQDTGGVNVDSEGSIYIGHENDPETAENEYVEGYIDAKDDVNLHAAEDIIISGKLHVNKNDGNLNLHADNGDITQTTIDEAENIAVENLTVAAINGNVELANKHNVIGNVDIMAVGGSLGLTVSNPAGFNVDMGGFTNKQGGDIKLTNSDGSVNITTKDIVDQAQKDPANINGSLTVTADKLVEETEANVNNYGILNAAGDISFNAEDNVNNKGALVAGRDADINFDAGNDVNNESAVNAGADVNFDAGNDVNNESTVNAGGDVGFGAGNDVNNENAVKAGTDVSFGAGNDIINNDIVDAGRNVNFNAAEDIYNNNTVNADETIEFTAVDGVINSDTVNGKDVIMQAIEQELENILAKDSVTLNGDRIHGQNITQNTEADGDLIINTDSNSGSGPIESLVIDKIDANDKSVFTELWAVEADITTVDDKMDFNDIMIEENAWLENSGTLATIYGNVPVKDDDANVHIYQSYPSMYVNFIDADTVETDGRLMSLDDYWYAYDQRFTAENHLRWQHGRYLDEDWKQAYGYGLSLHNRYGLIDYQEFTETNAGADEVAVEA